MRIHTQYQRGSPLAVNDPVRRFKHAKNVDPLCFTPGALIEGFSLIGIPVASNGDLVVATPLLLDIPHVVVGPDEFNE